MNEKSAGRIALSTLVVVCLVVAGLLLPGPASRAASGAVPRPWVRQALLQGTYEGRAVRSSCTWANCDSLPEEIDVALMITPRTEGVQVYSQTGDYAMRLGWVPGLGGYLGRRDLRRTWIREMQIVVKKQVQIDGVWTARKAVAVMSSWEPGQPHHGDTYRVALKRVSSGLDVAMVLDRTGSMTSADMTNMKAGAIAMLDAFDSPQIWAGLSVLPYGEPLNKCVVNDPQDYPDLLYEDWQVTPTSPDHSNLNGTLNEGSQIVHDIDCLKLAGSVVVTVNGVVRTGAGHTNLGDPLHAAHEMLLSEGRTDAPDVIVFVTDGGANQPDGMLPCAYFNGMASAAKQAGQTIFTIAFGVKGARCNRDTAGRYRNAYATTNLADAATASKDNSPGDCAESENTDGDHYFCRKGGSSLEPPFRQVAAAALGTVRTRPCRRGCW